MKKESLITKNIRPASLIFLLVFTSLLAIFDGNLQLGETVFNVGKEYISLYQNLLITAFAFYFGSRGFEKCKAMKHKQSETVEDK